jgi:hypothetical protein
VAARLGAIGERRPRRPAAFRDYGKNLILLVYRGPRAAAAMDMSEIMSNAITSNQEEVFITGTASFQTPVR